MTFRCGIGVVLIASLCVCAASEDATTVEETGAIERPGVLLTFDDAYVKEWVAAIPLFAKYNAHATFFVSQFDKLNKEQIEGLRTLKRAGHAIGCHGLRHRKAAEYARKHGVSGYLADEIEPALDLMKEGGFTPVSFAYPMSNRNDETDAALLKHFRHLRGGAFCAEGQRLAELDSIFTPLGELPNRGCLLGRSIDKAGEEGREHIIDEVKEALRRAKQRDECVVFYSHNIGTHPKNHIRPEALESILACGQQLGLPFYTYDNLPRAIGRCAP